MSTLYKHTRFGTLTVLSILAAIFVSFGIGIIKGKFKDPRCRECLSCKEPLVLRMGNPMAPRGWFFNVCRLDSVEIEISCGKLYRIGTDHPKELAQTIGAAREFIL